MESVLTRCRLLIGIGATAGLIGLVTGCSSSRPTRSPDVATASGAGGELVLPIDAYAFTNTEVNQMGLARTLLIGTCMRRFGFDFDPRTSATQNVTTTQNAIKNFGVYGNKRRYGVTDPVAAGKYGYHLPSVVAGAESPTPVKGKGDPHGLGKLTPAKESVLTGKAPNGGKLPAQVPAGGCVGEAGQKISGAAVPERLGEADLVSRISGDSFKRSLTDAAVTRAFTKWSECLKAKGYNYPTPREAGANFNIETRAVSPQEIAAAKADVACKKQTDLVDIWSGFEVKFQKAQIEGNAQELQNIRADHDARMKRVAEIIAKG